MEFLSYLISGISLGSVYAIIALGYTMVYGIAKMLNFAHGDVIMVGGYVSLMAVSSWGLPAWAAVIVAMVVCTVLGVIIEGLAYKPLRAAPSLAVLITAIGVSYFLQNSALLIWGRGRVQALRRQAYDLLHRASDGRDVPCHHGGADLLHWQDQDGQGYARRVRG